MALEEEAAELSYAIPDEERVAGLLDALGAWEQEPVKEDDRRSQRGADFW
jgi:hypothetical protein